MIQISSGSIPNADLSAGFVQVGPTWDGTVSGAITLLVRVVLRDLGLAHQIQLRERISGVDYIDDTVIGNGQVNDLLEIQFHLGETDTYIPYLKDTVAGSNAVDIDWVAFRAEAESVDLAAIKAKTDLITPGNVTIAAGFNGRDSLTIIKGDSYTNSVGTALTFPQPTGATWPSTLTSGWTVAFKATPNQVATDLVPSAAALPTSGSIAGVVVSASVVRFDLTAAQTALLTACANGYDFDVQATSGSERVTLIKGSMSVLPDVNTA
jgi:hypothetical protein